MITTNQQDDPRTTEGDCMEARILVEARKHGDIRAKGEQAFEHFLRIADGDREIYLGKTFAEGQCQLSDFRTDRGDAQLTGEQTAGRAQRFRGFRLEAEYPLRNRVQPAPHIAQLDVMAAAIEELDSEPLFERLDVSGDTRLPHEKSAGRRGKASVLRDGVKAAQLLEIDLGRNVDDGDEVLSETADYRESE
jgi:hypothetical protein